MLHVVNRARELDFKGDGLSSKGHYKDLHPSSKTEHKVEGGFLLDVVVVEGLTVFELRASEDETLLIWGDTILALDRHVEIIDCIGWLVFGGDGLARKGLDEDRHTSTTTEQGRLPLDVIVRERGVRMGSSDRHCTEP